VSEVNISPQTFSNRGMVGKLKAVIEGDGSSLRHFPLARKVTNHISWPPSSEIALIIRIRLISNVLATIAFNTLKTLTFNYWQTFQ